MPSSFRRLRFWLGLSALLMIAVVAGFFLYARYRVQKAIHDLPGRLGANIQQSTAGFTYSQAAGGHTIFTISASNAVRYKQGDKAELHNVKIVSYGSNSDRLDEISGDDFEYDGRSGNVSAKGKVAIDLQAVQDGSSGPGASPKRVGSPLHLDTSGLVFNQKTGLARTDDKITFQLPQGSGSAVGATYDSKSNTFSLHSDIHLFTSGPKPANLRADRAEFRQESQQLALINLHAESGIRRVDAQNVLLHLRDDNTVERAEASGGVNATVMGKRSARLHAAESHFTFGPQNRATSARFAGGVVWETTGAASSHGNAGEVLLAFVPGNRIKSAQLRGSVHLVQFAADADSEGVRDAQPNPVTPSPGSQKTVGRTARFLGDGLNLVLRPGGTLLQTATSVGPSEIVLGGALAESEASDSSDAKTVITAGSFEAKFSNDNRISTLSGSNPVKIVSSAPGKQDRVSESRNLLATFSTGKTHSLEQFVQTGDVRIREGERGAVADRATFSQFNDTLSLNGNVHYEDASTGAKLTSDALALHRATGEISSTGNVKTTYAVKETKSPGGMLSSSQAIHVTAPQMTASSTTGVARYSGGARLWQGGNILQGATIEFNRNARTLDARAQGSKRVSTVFVQAGKNGKQTPVEVVADHLRYDDAERKAVFDGSITVHSADSSLHANKAVVILRPQSGQGAAAKGGKTGSPSEVQSIDAAGNILLQQAGRKATGNRLIYTAAEEKFVLTGTPTLPPSIFDAEHGQVTGVSLTFFNHDGRVLVDSSNSTSITQTQLKK